MRQVEMIMGMPVSIDIPGASSINPFEKVFDFLQQVDARFSPYIESSEVGHFNKDKNSGFTPSADLLFIKKECERYEKLTSGYFSAYYAGVFEPSGYVKAWAMKAASHILEELGFTTFLINIAGDMIASGQDRVWTLGIQDPLQKQALLGTVQLTNQAVATSGSYVRASHILDPHTKTDTTDLISVSIYGDDIIDSDVLATACMAMGFDKACAFLQSHPDYASLLVKKNGEMLPVNNFALITKTQNVQ